MKLYRLYGTQTLMSDELGEILLNKTGQTVELDEERAKRHIAAGAAIEEVIEEKEHDNVSSVQ